MIRLELLMNVENKTHRLLLNYENNFIQTWHKSSLGICSNQASYPSPWCENRKILKQIDNLKKNCFSNH